MNGIRLEVSNDPVSVAWAAFDAAAIRLQRYYARAAIDDTPALRAERMAAAQETIRLWKEWRELFLTCDDEPRPAA